MTLQIETLTVAGTITLAGNATVTVTAANLTGSPLAVSVPVLLADDASAIALATRVALALNSAVSDLFFISGVGANVVLTQRVEAGNDATLSVVIADGTCDGITTSTSVNTLAGTMTITNGYCTLAELKGRILPSQAMADGSTMNTTEIDSNCSIIIEAVSRWIDSYCGRWFYTKSAQTFYYTPRFKDMLLVDDLISVTTLKSDDNGDGVYETTWATTDYVLSPLNAASFSRPYTVVELSELTSYMFYPGVQKQIEIVGSFGWSAVPHQIREACLLQSERIYMKRDAPLGVMGESRFGAIRIENTLDVDVKAMLNPYVKLV